MANKNRNKGNYHESKILEQIKKKGIIAEKQPLSGSLGGKYRGDIQLQIGQETLIVEVKYRDKSGFPPIMKTLENRDIAWYKNRSGEQIVFMTKEIFYKICNGAFCKIVIMGEKIDSEN